MVAGGQRLAQSPGQSQEATDGIGITPIIGAMVVAGFVRNMADRIRLRAVIAADIGLPRAVFHIAWTQVGSRAA